MVDRDSSGRFVKDNSASTGVSSGKTGRPSKKRERRFYEIALRACTFSDWRKIVKKAVEQALAGDAQARKFLADYLMGPPTQKLEHTGAGGGPMVFKEVVVELPPDEDMED